MATTSPEEIKRIAVPLLRADAKGKEATAERLRSMDAALVANILFGGGNFLDWVSGISGIVAAEALVGLVRGDDVLGGK